MGKYADLKLVIEFDPVHLQGGGVAPLEFLESPAFPGSAIQFIEDANGLLHLAEGDAPALVDRLLANEYFVNLFCAHR